MAASSIGRKQQCQQSSSTVASSSSGGGSKQQQQQQGEAVEPAASGGITNEQIIPRTKLPPCLPNTPFQPGAKEGGRDLAFQTAFSEGAIPPLNPPSTSQLSLD